MKLNKVKVFFTIAVIFASIITLIYFCFPSARIDAIYQGSDYVKPIDEYCKSTVILVSNAPITDRGRLSLWEQEKDNVMTTMPLQKKCDSIYFVKNKPEPPLFSEDVKYWQADEQFCFKGEVNGACISNKNIFMSISLFSLTTDGIYRDTYKDKTIYVSYR
ncbi:DUF943 family protein [Klebsiella michiganensis]|uniref:DUF943 family protein n=1 Tax=Klebsiella michiganensis TaxID=1134687 RepID=UPI0009497B38|nr:DUF943 family protein [Klebsiella michiganensis]